MLQYTQFYFENFKGIQNRLDFNLDSQLKHPYCLLGYNESGKTTILKGIELIGKLCEGVKIVDAERNSIRPKGSYFKGTIKLGTFLKCPKELIIKEVGKVKKYFQENKDLIRLEVVFSFEFKRSAFKKEDIEILVDGIIVLDKNFQEKILLFIQKNVQKILYYDDFKLIAPRVRTSY